MNHQTRRAFLKRAGALGSAALSARLLGQEIAPPASADPDPGLPELASRPSTGRVAPSAKSVVVDMRATEVISGQTIHEQLIGDMINEALRIATGAESTGEAWNRLIKPDDVVGIKFNHVGAETLATSVPFALRLVASLADAGVAPERIMLLEVPRHPRITELKTRPRVFGFSGGEVTFASGAEELSAVLQEVTAIVNVPFLKTHNIAGMTGCLKNLSHALVRRPQRYHADGCSPFVGDILDLPQIRSKLRLHIVNALRAAFTGGPAVDLHHTWPHAGILVSTDPVAADFVGLDIINARRTAADLEPIGDTDGLVPHIRSAADRNLGTDDQDYIDLLRPDLF